MIITIVTDKTTDKVFLRKINLLTSNTDIGINTIQLNEKMGG